MESLSGVATGGGLSKLSIHTLFAFTGGLRLHTVIYIIVIVKTVIYDDQ